MHPLVCYAASCSLYAGVLSIHHRWSLTMSTFIPSPDDDDDDDIMITLLLLAMCYPPVNKTPSFRESLTVDEVSQKKKWQNPSPHTTASIIKSILDFVQQQA